MLFIIFSITTACTAQELEFNEFLGDSDNIIRQSIQVQSARVSIVGVEEAKKQMLKNNNTLAGYPIIGSLKTLKELTSKKLANILLVKKNYSNIRQRCLNKKMQGVRFTGLQSNIEVVIGLPCNQIIFTLVRNSEVKYWGGVLGDNPSMELQKYLKFD